MQHIFYQNLVDVFDDGRLCLYQRPDRLKPKWIARFKFPDRKGYVIKTTRETDLRRAKDLATRWWYEFDNKLAAGLSIAKPTFEKLWAEFKPIYLARSKDKSRGYVTLNIRIIEKHFLSFASMHLVAEFNEKEIAEYFDQRMTASRPLKGSSAAHERTILQHLFTFAHEKKYINRIPRISIPILKSIARPDFEKNDYLKLTRNMREFVKNAPDSRIQRKRFYLQQYILILANSGARTGELLSIKWADISLVKDADGNPITSFRVTKGKTGSRTVICLPDTTKYFDRLKQFREKELGEDVPKNEFVFCKPDGSKDKFRTSFHNLLNFAGVEFDSSGVRRTLYSFRHTYITMRLNQGVSVYMVAMNCGTSVEMIEKFYGKRRVTEAKNVSQLTVMDYKQTSLEK